MGRLPPQKKILREDLKDAPSWVNPLIDTLNNFMESVYQSLNKNITFEDNVSCFIKELIYKTPSTYPTMDNVEFTSLLKVKATGVQVLQVYNRATYEPATGAVYVPWVEDNSTIRIFPITGLAASTTYVVRLLVS
jgi:hypothetical protein